MKHPYQLDCPCPRCTRERIRRQAQTETSNLRSGGTRYASGPAMVLARQRKDHPVRERRPVPGSQEWAETRGDDLGDSPDY